MKCPGQDSRYWKPGAIFEEPCPKCGHLVEFFKDDTARKCGQCGHRFVNPRMDFGCAAYCEFAEQCLGDMPPELLAAREDLLKDRVALEMKRYFKTDFRRIGHATRVARYAERIGRKEAANMAVVLCAAYLHDVDLPEAEHVQQNSAARYPERKAPAGARKILIQAGAEESIIEAVCALLGRRHHPLENESIDFKVLHDAEHIASLEELHRAGPTEDDHLRETVRKNLLTETGREEGDRILAISESPAR